MCMSRTILALALASSVSAYLLPAKVQGRVRGVYAPLASSALLSMRSRPLYMMSIDPDALAQPCLYESSPLASPLATPLA